MTVPPDLLARIRHHAAERPDAPAITFVDFAADPEGAPATWTYADVDRHARRVAALLGAHCPPDRTAAICCPQGLDYAAAFLGCLYAGVCAVPLYVPVPFRHNGRLRALLGQAAPACVLTTAGHASAVARLTGGAGADPAPVVLDTAAPAPPRDVERMSAAQRGGAAATGEVAYLQYTSGSTGAPRGVRVTRANIAHTAEQSGRAFGQDAASVSVTWLPLFHDFGLAAAITVPLHLGCHAVLFDPMEFVLRPLRWLRLISEHGGTFAPCPDFALGMLCDAAEAAPADELRGLDLTTLKALVNGSEPVRPASLDRFTRVFAPYGFTPEAHAPAYGLAEATILVSATPPGARPRVFACDRRELAKGQAVPAAEGSGDAARAVVECGTAWGQEFAVVDPATLIGLPPRHVGEIWARGPAVTAGYHGSPAATAEVYGRRRADAAPNEPADWLRTGDLGFVDDGHLFVVGRLKDLVIIDGRNHHPADLEATVAAAPGAAEALRRGHAAAVPVDDGEGEYLVVIAERAEGVVLDELAERRLAARVRTAIAERHGVGVHSLVLVDAGTLPKTSSGKLRRAECRERYLAGRYS
ncbi:acyl-CoA synthetase (AMP-forming)/AMP-acid ligase II [Streptomonospora nanhaiensis]|uniref:Acyl-CoA synthetase (AMP-forming)/AMP-acid ligase II n=1 Tax=Streptomonospora nanhaiensis TaxID=1323731 RepID=A0A853BQN4_9ACTN|nr:fatty acyl-AMP ligase [Streptomonospora nanhaiensis]NYI97144.1 acyl-CoA synthetase (AMP-forming)/AMP-acid ligase II [Streptomonospora nanhaiensis]